MSNNKIFIKHHLGLGDCIVHNGMVRKFLNDYPDYEIWISEVGGNDILTKRAINSQPYIGVMFVSSNKFFIRILLIIIHHPLNWKR